MAKYGLQKALRDYTSECDYFEKQKANGVKTISAHVAGDILAKGRKDVHIDEVIAFWKKGLKELKSGEVNPEDYRY